MTSYYICFITLPVIMYVYFIFVLVLHILFLVAYIIREVHSCC